MEKKNKKTKVPQKFAVIIGEEITDPDIKAIYLISEAMKISTPRMRKANLEFVLSKYKLFVRQG
jgi:hypothetical protein